MSVSFYFFHLLQDYKSENDTFLTSLVVWKQAVYWRR